jgi:hypothetical protein
MGDVDLSLLTRPPAPNASLPLTLINWESEEKDGMLLQNTSDNCGSWGPTHSAYRLRRRVFIKWYTATPCCWNSLHYAITKWWTCNLWYTNTSPWMMCCNTSTEHCVVTFIRAVFV